MRTSAAITAGACVLLVAAACGPRPVLDPRPSMTVTADRLEADGLVAAGCYACLTDALAIYERIAATGAAPAAGIRAIDTALLLALREREIGLAGGRSLDRAVELANLQIHNYAKGHPEVRGMGTTATVAGGPLAVNFALTASGKHIPQMDRLIFSLDAAA